KHALAGEAGGVRDFVVPEHRTTLVVAVFEDRRHQADGLVALRIVTLLQFDAELFGEAVEHRFAELLIQSNVDGRARRIAGLVGATSCSGLLVRTRGESKQNG